MNSTTDKLQPSAPPPPINLALVQAEESASTVAEDKNEAKDLHLDQELVKAQAKGALTLYKAISSAMIWGLRIAAIAIICMMIVRVIHLMAPTCWLWLTPERLQEIDKLLFSSVLGGLVAKYVTPANPKG